ncbi:hypothetical protein [Plantactinospora sonchi]|uniref:Uncharacterized protein n=1 Tax=Plantactinospora sonchi TaxID=1544735 RepID=A0ABU7RZG6_9ACTN
MTATRRWVIFFVCLSFTVAAGLATVFFGLSGLEAAGWVAGVVSGAAGVAAAVMVWPRRAGSPPPDRPDQRPQPTPHGPRAIVVDGELRGIASTGDNASIVQHRDG